MKETIRFQIIEATRRLRNAKKKVEEINSKIGNLQRELQILEGKINSDWELIASLGMKEPSRDQENPDSEKELQEKRSYNEKLISEKRNLLEAANTPERGLISDENLSDFEKSLSLLTLGRK